MKIINLLAALVTITCVSQLVAKPYSEPLTIEVYNASKQPVVMRFANVKRGNTATRSFTGDVTNYTQPYDIASDDLITIKPNEYFQGFIKDKSKPVTILIPEVATNTQNKIPVLGLHATAPKNGTIFLVWKKNTFTAKTTALGMNVSGNVTDKDLIITSGDAALKGFNR